MEIFYLSEPNTVLYYTNDPKVILIHCNNSILPPPYESAIVTLEPDCKIETKNTILQARVTGENKQSFIYFKPKTDITWSELSNNTNFNFKPISVDNNVTKRNSYSYNINNDIFEDDNFKQNEIVTHLGISTISLVLLIIIVLFMIYYYGIRRLWQIICRCRNQSSPTEQPQQEQIELYNRRRHFNNRIEENSV